MSFGKLYTYVSALICHLYGIEHSVIVKYDSDLKNSNYMYLWIDTDSQYRTRKLGNEEVDRNSHICRKIKQFFTKLTFGLIDVKVYGRYTDNIPDFEIYLSRIGVEGPEKIQMINLCDKLRKESSRESK